MRTWQPAPRTGMATTMLAGLLSACGGGWSAGFVWDGRDDEGNGGVVVIVTRYPASALGTPAPAPQTWQLPVAQATVALQAELARVQTVSAAACDPDAERYALLLTSEGATRRYLSDNAACQGDVGDALGYVAQNDLRRMTALLQEAH